MYRIDRSADRPHRRHAPAYDQYLAEAGRQEFWELAAEYDAPAFVRRAQRTEQAAQVVFDQCQQARERMLEITKIRLAILATLIEQQWQQIAPELAVSDRCSHDVWQADYFAELYDVWQPKLRVRIEPTSSRRRIRRAIRELDVAFDASHCSVTVLDSYGTEPGQVWLHAPTRQL